MINNDSFRLLIRKAMGEMNQKDFASKCGISEFTISRFMSSGTHLAPSEKTLSKIAAASDGRVTLPDLLFSIGKYKRANELLEPDLKGDSQPHKLYDSSVLLSKMKAVVDDLISDLDGKLKYQSVDDWLDIFDMLYGPVGFSYREQFEVELDGNLLSKRNFNGSAYCTPITFTLADEDSDITAYLVFAVFYVKTTKTAASDSGIVILDKAFDLETLDSVRAEDLSEMYKQVDETEGTQLADFDFCYYEKSPDTGERNESC